MDIEQLRRFLDDYSQAEPWLRDWGIVDPRRAHRSLVELASGRLTLDLLATICQQLTEHLSRTSDPDMALNNLCRFFDAQRNPLSLGSLLERDREALPVLLQIFSASQYLSDLLITDAESYDLLRLTEGQPVNRQTLVDELVSEMMQLTDPKLAASVLRRYKRRETLRISYGDIVRGHRLETVTAQISHLADAIVEAAVSFCRRDLEAKRGVPRGPAGQRARFVVLAMGKLGGEELNYSSDIDLVFLYDPEGMTDGGRALSNGEFFDRLARDVVKMLTERTEAGHTYRVDLRLRPEGERGPMVPSLEAALHYYDVLGRTWERQAYVKARPIAGDISLGEEFLAQLEPWIYRRYLSLADITGIKALKRRIEQRSHSDGEAANNVKTGHGGIRDVEFVIQFLQLLNGGDLPEVRTGNTMLAISRLEQVGCLTPQERSLLEENYSFLRKIEHRLQIMFDLQTHVMPSSDAELRKLALRLGYADTPEQTALDAFKGDHRTQTELNRKILDHLLHDAFGNDTQAEPEVDLVLDPAPPPERIREVLSRYKFRDLEQAYRNLMALSAEKIRFLSTRRCRHFLASIAPALLSEIAATSDPDSTLVNLVQVSDSLGGKGVLWELFSFNPPTLKLYVDLCATSPFLSGILISNPGMIDELLDSLLLGNLPSLESLRDTLTELSRAAEDLDPILHSFKNTQQLRVGVRDIVGKETTWAVTGTLTDIAEVCLERIAREEYAKLAAKLGEPTVATEDGPGGPCGFVIIGMGKFGGRELNYRSDLDVVFLYEAEGSTQLPPRAKRAEKTNNQHFFSELAQRIIKVCGQLGPYGRLYEIDPRLRPTGRGGSLATSLQSFARYHAEGDAQLWERQALTKARVVCGDERMTELATAAIYQAAYQQPLPADFVEQIRQMRSRMQDAHGELNLKRAPGGLVDIEFLVQLLQLRHGAERAELRTPHTLECMRALNVAGLLSEDDFKYFRESYRFLRTLESRLRLMNAGSRDDLPEDPVEQAKLALPLGFGSGEELIRQLTTYKQENRRRFDRIFNQVR